MTVVEARLAGTWISSPDRGEIIVRAFLAGLRARTILNRLALGNRFGPGIQLAASALTTDGSESLAKDADSVSAPETRSENTDNSGIRCASSPEKAAFTEGVLGPRAAIGIAAIADEKSALDAKRPITEGREA